MKSKKSRQERTYPEGLRGKSRFTRRTLLKALASGIGTTSLLGQMASSALAAAAASPVTTNLLRPPGAVPEEIFPAKCIRCGRCVEVCPYDSIRPPDIRSGIYAGTPLIDVIRVPCYLCMKCVEVCPTGTLSPISQQETRMGLAVIDKHACVTWNQELALCRTCYNVCPFKEKAIKLDQLRPVVIEEHCTGCGICTHGCPINRKNGRKAINIQPIYAFKPVKW